MCEYHFNAIGSLGEAILFLYILLSVTMLHILYVVDHMLFYEESEIAK